MQNKVDTAQLLRAENILKRINELAEISENPTCLTRTFGTAAFLQGSRKIYDWMIEAGLDTRIDNIGNVRGIWKCEDTKAKTLVFGSHMDTVTDAGKFDGPLGIIMAIDIVENLIKNNIPQPYHIECIAFSDEEGVRFHTSFLGSQVVAGTFDKSLLFQEDARGTTLNTVIRDMKGNENDLGEDAIPSGQWKGYFEIHIEQGPVLFQQHIPIGIVTGIAAQKRIIITLRGVTGHAGTVPLRLRQDALCSAAECIIEIEKFAKESIRLVATVGQIDIQNAASNVIPGKVSLSLDIRSLDFDLLESSTEIINTKCQEICVGRNIEMHWHVVQESKPVMCDPGFMSLLKKAIINTGYEPIELVSGAGHDGIPLSSVSPIAMLFVRCFEGISHNPLENVEIMDIAAAVSVSDSFFALLNEDSGH